MGWPCSCVRMSAHANRPHPIGRARVRAGPIRSSGRARVRAGPSVNRKTTRMIEHSPGRSKGRPHERIPPGQPSGRACEHGAHAATQPRHRATRASARRRRHNETTARNGRADVPANPRKRYLHVPPRRLPPTRSRILERTRHLAHPHHNQHPVCYHDARRTSICKRTHPSAHLPHIHPSAHTARPPERTP